MKNRLYLLLAVSFLCAAVTGCDLGTYGTRVKNRDNELRDPSLKRQREVIDTTSDYGYFHEVYIGFYNANGRVAANWQELNQFAPTMGQRGTNATAAIQRVNEGGYIPNWNLDPGDSSITNLDGQTILTKPTGGTKVLYNGTIIP